MHFADIWMGICIPVQNLAKGIKHQWPLLFMSFSDLQAKSLLWCFYQWLGELLLHHSDSGKWKSLIGWVALIVQRGKTGKRSRAKEGGGPEGRRVPPGAEGADIRRQQKESREGNGHRCTQLGLVAVWAFEWYLKKKNTPFSSACVVTCLLQRDWAYMNTFQIHMGRNKGLKMCWLDIFGVFLHLG